MNDQDLERELRSQRSPREDGYRPAPLPMSLEDGSARRPRASILPRAAMFAGVALAGALAVAVVTGIFSGGEPNVGATGSATPSADITTPVATDCVPADLTFTAEPWGGAAGSRGTSITVTLATRRSTCQLPLSVTWQLQDANGTVLISGESASAAGAPLLEPGAIFAGSVEWSNWCGSDPASPVELAVRLGTWPAVVPVAVPAGGLDPVPPCMGDQPSTLGVRPFQLWP